MADDEERLVVLLEARIKDLERNMAKASGTTAKEFRKMSLSSKTATKQMEEDAIRSTKRINQAMASVGTNIGAVGKAFAGGLAGAVVGVGIAGVISSVREVAAGVAEIGDQAKIAGLSAKAFQEWKYVAQQARIPVDAITDGLKELQLRADEFAVTGKGSAAEAFQRLGLTPKEVKEKLKDPSELLLLLIQRTGQLKDTAAGIRIFDELFGGTGGERMVSLIQQGEEGIRAQIKAANDFGHVLSDDVIKKAQEIDQKFNEISSTVGNTLKSAIVSVVGSMMDFMDGLRRLDRQRASTIQNSINDIMRQKQETKKALDAIDAADGGLNNRMAVRARATHEMKLKQLSEQENRLIAELENRPAVMTFAPNNSGAWTPPEYKTPTTTTKKERPDEYARATESIRERITVMKAEYEAQAALNPLIDDYGFAVEKAGAKQDLLNAAKAAGVKITPELTAEVEKLSTAYANSVVEAKKLGDTQEEIRHRAEEANQFNKTLTRGIVDGFVEGKNAADTFADALKKIGYRLLDMAFDDLFPSPTKAGSSGGGLLSGIGKALGFYSDGGFTGAGGKYEPAGIVHKGEVVFSQADVRRFGGVGRVEALRRGYADGGPVAVTPAPAPMFNRSTGGASANTTPFQINYNPVIDNRGADAAAVVRLEQAQAQDRKMFAAQVINAVRDAKARGIRF